MASSMWAMLRLPAVVPQEAIQHGKETAKYLRYHHPGVTLKDMLDQAKANKVWDVNGCLLIVAFVRVLWENEGMMNLTGVPSIEEIKQKLAPLTLSAPLPSECTLTRRNCGMPGRELLKTFSRRGGVAWFLLKWTYLSKVFRAEDWQSLSSSSHRMGNDQVEPCFPPRTPGRLPKKTRALWNWGYPWFSP